MHASLRTLPLVASFVLVAGTAAAQERVRGYTLGGGISTLGATIEFSHVESDSIRVRGLIAGTPSFDFDDTYEDVDVDLEGQLQNFAVIIDYYPTPRNWRVSGGILYSTSDVTGRSTAAPGNVFDLNGQTFSNGERLTVTGDTKLEFMPIVTTGYDFRLSERWIVGGEIGAIYTGGFDVDTVASTPELQTAFDEDEEAQDEIRRIEDFSFVPYIGLTATYRF